MSQTLTTLVSKVRYLIGDISSTSKDIFTYGSSAVFTLSEENPIAITAVSVNDIESGVTYTFDTDTNKVTITSSLTSGDTVTIDYTYYPNYSANEIEAAVRSSLVHLSVNNFYDFIVEEDDAIYPEPDTRETNLIAMITSILLEPNNISYSLPDIKITSPDNLSTSDKIRRTIAICKKNSHGIFFLA